nr:NBS-LRR disease resistance protein [Dasypyrum villosum]
MGTILEVLLRSSANKLQDIITSEAILILGVEEELTEVLRRVELIRCCIHDAEKRRTKELTVNNWLGQLRDVIYDVDEIMDVARCKGSKLLPDHPPSSSTSKSLACKALSVSSCFCNIRSRRDVAVRIRSLDRKIENISKDKIFLTFNTTIQPIRNGPTTKRIRSSNLVGSNLVGKEIIHSSRKLVDLVLAHKENKSYKLAIVGTGGVGKTTLAQKIYNDQKVKGSFKMHAWICVSHDYNEVTLLKEVLRNIGVHHEQGETIAELQRKLAETIEGKSFFLVLDDVWHSNVWMDLLRPPLHETTSGVILITTRDDQITSRIGVEHTHRVDLMSKEVQQLRNTGIEIVRKCGHLPLAIKVTASALASRDLTENEWKRYLGKYVGSQSMLSDEIEGALYLSYDELPHRLKQCFLYCALYGEDSIIWRNEVTLLWIAEGFIEEQQGQLLEDIAEEYYYELIHRNLLQPDSSSFDSYPVGDGNANAVIQDGWKLEELSSLSQMRYLSLDKLERAAHSSRNAVLTDKRHLRKLILQWTETNTSAHLESLCILRFFGQQYPTWFGTTCLSSLMSLILKGVRSCVHLPPLEATKLEISENVGAYAVTRICPTGEVVLFEEEVVAADVKGEDGAAEIRKDDAQPARCDCCLVCLELKLLGCPKLRISRNSLEKIPHRAVQFATAVAGEDMQEVSTRWVHGLQEQHQRLHGEYLDVYTWR